MNNLKKAQWILDEAYGYLRDSECCLSLYKNFEEYRIDLEDFDWTEEEIQDKKEEIEYQINIDLPFFIIERIGTDLFEYVSAEHVKKHDDLFEYFDERNDLYERNFNSQLIYVSTENYQTFKSIIKSEFSQVYSKSPYSTSAYNATDIGWGYKPEGSLRVADHWNFETYDRVSGEYVTHCQTTEDLEDELAICRFNSDSQKYEIVFRDYYPCDVIPVRVTKEGLVFLEDEEVTLNVA